MDQLLLLQSRLHMHHKDVAENINTIGQPFYMRVSLGIIQRFSKHGAFLFEGVREILCIKLLHGLWYIVNQFPGPNGGHWIVISCKRGMPEKIEKHWVK